MRNESVTQNMKLNLKSTPKIRLQGPCSYPTCQEKASGMICSKLYCKNHYFIVLSANRKKRSLEKRELRRKNEKQN